jgi:NADPH-dependent curcumin reductase CurA
MNLMHLLLVVDELIPTSRLNTDKTDNPDEIFAKEAPEGIDVNWVNVGGKAFETELAHSASHGRVIVCGWISAYNGKSDGITNLFQIVAKRLQ